tara:strand:+ start:776 stop:943 length:168 start_codon:yes stop_codon:yes gene_type:complete
MPAGKFDVVVGDEHDICVKLLSLAVIPAGNADLVEVDSHVKELNLTSSSPTGFKI